jgi:pimeloyl-[acyl-carrier protein] synthase
MNARAVPRSETALLDRIQPVDAFFYGVDINPDPFPVYERWLRDLPIHRCERSNYWYVCSHRLISEILLHKNTSSDRIAVMHQNLTETQRELYAPLLDSLSRWILYIDPPKHKEIRAVFNQALSKQVIDSLKEKTTDIANELLDELDPSRPWDLIKEFSYPLPVIVISELLGVPRQDRKIMKRWSDDIAKFVGMKTNQDEIGAQANQSLTEISAYLRELISQQRRAPRDNLLQKMIGMTDGSSVFTEQDLIANAVAIIFAGHETTTNLIANALFELFHHPPQMERLLASLDDEEALGCCVEECLRFDSPIQYISRVASGDIELGSHVIKRGEAIVLVIGAANRDPAVYPRPHQFDISRKRGNHLALGWGAHMCSGAALARREITVALETVLKRFPGLGLAPGHGLEWHTDLGLRALKRLMVVSH